jgi:hypothetical protein
MFATHTSHTVIAVDGAEWNFAPTYEVMPHYAGIRDVPGVPTHIFASHSSQHFASGDIYFTGCFLLITIFFFGAAAFLF